MIRLPGKKWFQSNRSNVLGNLWSSFNIDLQSNLGTLRVSPRLKVNTATADVANLNDVPCAFEYFNSAFYTIANTRVFKGGANPDSAFAQDTGTNTQSTYVSGSSDLENFNGLLFSTTTNEIWSLSGTTWTRRGGATPLTSATSHMLTYFKKFNRLYVIASDDLVYSFDTAYTLATSGDYSLNFATSQQYSARCMKATSDSVWIGVGSQLNPQAKGKIFQWDGISAQPTQEYTINANACISLVIVNDVPYAMGSNGILYAFTGSAFEEVGRLPTNKLDITALYGNEAFIHPNGMILTKNKTIQVLINNLNNDTNDTIAENLPSGVWEWSPTYGFTHKHSVSYNPAANATITDYGQNRVAEVGALFDCNVGTTGNGSVMAGVKYYTNASSSTSAVLIDDSNDTVQKFGYFVTTWFSAAGLSDCWAKLALFYRQCLASTDRLTLKYRLTEAASTEISITWVNTTSFTTTTDVSGMIGYEVEGIQGTGSGFCAHITAVTGSGTYTVTVDEAFTGVTTGTAKVRLQAWKKLFQVADQNSEQTIRQLLRTSPRLQLKTTMLFTGEDELHELAVINRTGEQLA